MAYTTCMNGKINVEKQVAYWCKGGREDWTVGVDLVKRGRVRHGMFFVHLALEKTLKAHVCKATRDFAPKIHSLIRLLELSTLDASEEQRDTLAKLTRFNLAGRYPDSLEPQVTKRFAMEEVASARKVYLWLRNQF